MLREPQLSEAQMAAFQHDGFVIVPGVFDADEIAMIGAWVDELAARPEESGKHWVYHETSKLDPETDLIARIENMSPFIGALRKWQSC